jgi:hypothetical protein
MTDFVALRNGGRSSPPDSFRASRSRPSFLSGLGSDNKETKKRQEVVRSRFFKNDSTISDDRLNRRFKQFQGEEKFKQNLLDKGRTVTGLTNPDPDNPNISRPVFMRDVDSQGNPTRSLTDVRQDLAMRFGPKPSEIMSDIGKGVGNIMSAVAEKGTPMMQFLNAMKSGVQNFFSPNTMQVPTAVGTPFQTMNFDQIAQTAKLFDKARENKPDGRINMSDISNVVTELDPMGGMTLNNLTPIGIELKNRLQNDRPGITDDELLESLQRIDRAGFAGMGKPVFFLANGGIATLQ